MGTSAWLLSAVQSGLNGDKGTMKTVPRESWESLRQEKLDLDESLKQKEKRLLRLQQVFTAKSSEFREAIASILGLKLAFYPNGQVRVTSMYDLGASFVFQPLKSSNGNDGGETKMQLIGQGEGGPQELEQLMNYWVQQEMSIPCFLASVTLECYDKIRRGAREQRRKLTTRIVYFLLFLYMSPQCIITRYVWVKLFYFWIWLTSVYILARRFLGFQT